MHLTGNVGPIPAGVALTEFYDVLELQSKGARPKIVLQQEFADFLSGWAPLQHHKYIIKWAQRNHVPILTTNFDTVLSQAGDCELQHTTQEGFTDFYPWNSYFGNSQLISPTADFGIWHINGTVKYRRSIRLGLTHYMGSVERARGLIKKGNERRLLSENNLAGWPGVNSWLHIIFHKPLLIFGLELDENEIFLRWLLIERARYYYKFPARKKMAWYAYTSSNEKDGKLFFLKGVGVTPIKVNDYADIYGNESWPTARLNSTRG